MKKLENNLETIVHYVKQIEGLVGCLNDVKNEKQGSICSAIGHFMEDLKIEIDEFQDEMMVIEHKYR
jgi:hypothetical protein